jgi:hypothetical protein
MEQYERLSASRLKSSISRDEFLRKIVRYLLIAMLSIIVFTLGGRVVTGKECAGCTLKNTCSSRSDCKKK